MSKKRHMNNHAHHNNGAAAKPEEQNKQNNSAADEEPQTMDVLDTEQAADEEETLAEAGAVNLAEELDAARQQIEKDKTDYLMLMADFDNYRKRMLREKADLLKNAAERTLLDLLPIVDDFERGLAASKDENADAVRQGMELIYNKLIKYLESKGVKPIETTGETFNADVAEAIAMIPAPSEDLKGKILDTTQKGYMINDKVLRHAKVVVGE